jgi:prepilin-type N-terminal cleavage/methylation domain-containing protein
MNAKTISVIALSNRDFDSFNKKLEEAARWIGIAAGQGAELIVLPEMINSFCGDGVGNPRAVPIRQSALLDWRRETQVLLEAAKAARVALALPVVHLEEDVLFNTFFLMAADGSCLGRYDKACPTTPELAAGMLPGGDQPLLQWEGISVGGAICFDTCFPGVIERQIAAGAQLILVPSLWPGGRQLNYFALQYATRFAVAYPAWSRIIDIDGKEVVEGGYRQETLRFGFGVPVYTATLNFSRVALFANENQQKIETLSRKYGDRIRVAFDQENCLFFLDTIEPGLTEEEIVREFELVTARDYFATCAKAIKLKERIVPASRRHSLSQSRAFSLIELLVSMAIITILASLTSASIAGIGSANALSNSASDLGDILAQARTYAMGNDTYVYVGLEELNATPPDNTAGVGRVAVAVVGAEGGTRPYGNTPGPLSDTGSTPVVLIARPQVFNNLHIAYATDLTNGNMATRPASSTAGFVDLGNVMNTGEGKSTVTFQWPLSGPAKYTFDQVVIEFNPQGTARFQTQSTVTSTVPSYLELPLLPAHGTVIPTGAVLARANEAALQIDGMTGVVQTYRP